MRKLIAFGFALVLGTTSMAYADEASDTRDKINALQQQLDVMKAQLEQLKAQQQKAAPAAAAAPAPGASFIQLKKGDTTTLVIGGEEVQLYGNLDLSYDVTTKGIARRYPDPAGTGFVSPEGNVGWLSAISTNLSYIGVRGAHKIGKFSSIPYQLETQLDISSTSGTVNTNSNNDAVVKGGLTSRNSYIGYANKYFGAVKIGKTDAPYKLSTQRMNPFSGELGDYSVIMGNSGGDNRVEFGTRLDHALWYESPNWGGIAFSALVSPGQNRAFDNTNIPAGEAGCAGGNLPGSGATPPGCNDGSYGSAYSAALTYLHVPFYLAAAYELHKKVNRSSDTANLDPNDVADEQALKFGAQYTFGKATTLSAIYEDMQRYVPAYLQFQNERSRSGYWLALTQLLNKRDNLNFGWGHANSANGDPGQHNSTPGAGVDNAANLYTIAFKHSIDRNVQFYVDYAMTVNHPWGHYDLGAGGRGITTDCHDGAQIAAFDVTANNGAGGVSGTGPHCFAGGILRGFSTGLDLRF